MTHTLFGSKGSGSAAAEMALRAAAIPYRLVHASSWEPDSAQAELAVANPMRQIPTLVLPGGTVVSESAAILIHLGLSWPHSGLLPAQPEARAQALRGLVFVAANCCAAVSVSDFPQRWTTAATEPAHEAVRAAAHANLHRYWEMFADTFGDQAAFHAGLPDALCMLAVVVSRWSGSRAHLEANRPAFYQALVRLQQHERIAPVLGEHWDS